MSREGQQLLNDGRFEEALLVFSETQDLAAVFGRGVALHLLGRFDEAETCYQRVLASDPKHEEAITNLIAMNVERFDLVRTEAYARQLLSIRPDSPVALQALVVVSVERREYDAAAKSFARLGSIAEPGRDGIEYRLSRQVADRLKDLDGPPAHSH